MFRNTGANAIAKNQTRLAYEDKRDLYCIRTQVVTGSYGGIVEMSPRGIIVAQGHMARATNDPLI